MDYSIERYCELGIRIYLIRSLRVSHYCVVTHMNMLETYALCIGNISSMFSINPEAFASEFLENIAEICPRI